MNGDQDLSKILGNMNREELEKLLQPILNDLSKTTTNVNKLLVCLYSKMVIDMDQMDEIEELSTDYKRSQKIYKTIIKSLKGGELVLALRDAGQTHILKLISEQLRPKTLATPAPVPAPVTVPQVMEVVETPSTPLESAVDPSPSPSPLEDDVEVTISCGETNQIPHSPASEITNYYLKTLHEKASTLKFSKSSRKGPEQCYNVKGPGCVLILNNKFNAASLKKHRRNGADADYRAIKDLCVKVLKIDPSNMTYVENVASSDLPRILTKFKNLCQTVDCGYILVFVMTHGGHEADCLMMNDLKMIHLHRDLIYEFGTKYFPFGKAKDGGIPKIFLVQACRDNTVRTPTPKPHTDSTKYSEGDHLSTTYDDIFLGQSAMPLYVSYRDDEMGSFYIRALVAIFERFYKSLDLLSMVQESGKLVTYLCIEFNKKMTKENPANQVEPQNPNITLTNFNRTFYFT